MNKEKHSIEGAFVLVLFAVFAVAIIVVLVLGAVSYKGLVKRDKGRYDKRIITSYVAAKVRGNDVKNGVAVGGFADAAKNDGVETLHLYGNIEGEKVDTRIYYYKEKIYELYTLEGLEMKPEAGNPILDAKGLSFHIEGGLLQITSMDANGVESTTTVALRSESEVAS